MTRVDFYQIDTEELANVFCCRLINKAFRQGHQVYVHTKEKDQAKEMDNLLWSFRDNCFIPHAIMGEDLDEELREDVKPPVHIGFTNEPGHHEDVMVNLSGQIPDFFSRFNRVAEIVPFDKDMRESARQNYQFYKDRGYSVHYHTLDGKNGKEGKK